MKRPGSTTSTRYNRKGSKCEQRDLSTGKLLGHKLQYREHRTCVCLRCGAVVRDLKMKDKPFDDKRNFRRSDPRYAEHQKLIAATNGYV